MSANDLDSIAGLNQSRDAIRRALIATPSSPAEAVNQWLSEHPIKLASEALGDVTKSVVSPIAQRNPILFVATSLVVGGVLVWSRPWNWLLKPAIIAGLVPKLLSKVIAYAPKKT
jgi:hypothetical protein